MATGISISSTSGLSTGQKILLAAAMLANEPAAPDPDLIESDRLPVGHKQRDLVIMARLAQASALTEGVDVSEIQQLVANTVSITPTEHGLITTLSKPLIRRQGDQNLVATVGKSLGGSLRRRMANDVIALYDGFSKSSPGASLTLDITHFRGANAYLMTDNNSAYGPAQPPFRAALHIEQISDIILDITDTTPRGTTVGFTEEMLQRWWKARDRLYGVEVFHAGNIATDTNGDAKGGIFNPAAAHITVANDADVVNEPDNSARLTEYGIFQEWSEAEQVDVWGVEVFSDGASTL